ncbi:Associate of Myc 1 domain-containing protein [Rozella allomycis CSF55]|uniref:Associate of Myc 1 domain-containing protein n=1 Tax=Rozella allomycis (strain CSF55) TaxID=988480 RepID=A0A075AVB1_ROZAC|nr:Associate of Myc 1 domain-containing protein [Rozella allomycis CSF55]|eukprot:EPZ32489.1 Associate of Myc 1 domain-containing protein [Rozella allomycis CSF55]
MQSVQVDQKKEDFRKYLEKNGIIDSLTKVLVGLYEESEKPENPLEFIKAYLGGPANIDVEALRAENEDLRRQNDELLEKVNELTQKLNGAAGATDNQATVQSQ